MRDPLEVMAISGGGAAYHADVADFSRAAFERVLTRAERIARGETADDALNILALSGGAEGAPVGAGYLARWDELGYATAAPLPQRACRRERAAGAGAISAQNRARWSGEPRGG